MRSKLHWLQATIISGALYGCLDSQVEDPVPEKSVARDERERKEEAAAPRAPEALAKAADGELRYIGVLKGAACPAGSTEEWIYMDNDNATYWYQTMYLSATLPDGSVQNKSFGDWSSLGLKGVYLDYSLGRPTNTKLTFCKMLGSVLPTAKRDYAVLRFDSECPTGGIPFGLVTDDEDSPAHNNLNAASSGIWPNYSTKGGGLLGSTQLEFCYVPGNPQATNAWWTNHGAGVFTNEEELFGFSQEMRGKFRMSAEAQLCCYSRFDLSNAYWTPDNSWKAQNFAFMNSAHITMKASWKKP